MAHTHSVCSMYQLGHDECTVCHPHNIECISNTLIYLQASTQPLSTGQGQHHMNDTPIPACILQDVL